MKTGQRINTLGDSTAAETANNNHLAAHFRDATKTVPIFLKEHPNTIIVLAYFDSDFYKPTKDCLKAIPPYATKETVFAFDELNCPEFPSETLAACEVLGLSRYAIRHDPCNPLISYIVIE